MLQIFTHLANWSTYTLLGLDPQTHLAHAVHFFIEDTAKIFFLITAMMLFVGFFRTWISPEKTRTWLENKPKILAYILAVGLGAITPFCSCSSIPLFIAFLSAGIPLGVTMAFLITSPMVNEVAAVLFGEAIGWKFTLAYVGTGMLTGFLGGLLIDYLKLEKWVEPFAFEDKAQKKPKRCSYTDATALLSKQKPCSVEKSDKEQITTSKNLESLVYGAKKPTTIKSRFTESWNETKKILNRVWAYVFIGVGIGAVIHGFIPQEWFIAHAGSDNIFAVPLAVIMAVPLYSNVTGIVPIADVLIAKGLPIGTTLAFLMSTVAISLPEFIILRKVLKLQMLAFFVAYLTLAFITVGYVFNAIF